MQFKIVASPDIRLADQDWGLDGLSPVPDPNALLAYAKCSHREVRWMVGLSEGRAAILLPFYIERRRISGVTATALSFAGSDFFDYIPLYFSGLSIKEFRKELKRASGSLSVDVIYLNKLVPVSPEQELDAPLTERTQVFNSTKDEQGWQAVLSKKSLRRHRNAAKRDFRYRVVHYDGNAPNEVLDSLIALHKERWAFDNVKSPLHSAQRREVYSGCRQDAVVTVVHVDDEILACHFGLKFSRTMIWHTPAINIKYLNWSPLEVLLLEVAEFCQKNEVDILDFGLGGENYKARFSNELREVFEILIPVSFLGHTIAVSRRVLRSERSREIIETAVSWARAAATTLRQKVSSVVIFESIGGRDTTEPRMSSGTFFYEIDTYAEFVEFARKRKFVFQRHFYRRLEGGAKFICIATSDSILSFGWATSAPHFAIGETGKTIQLGGKTLLFDFVTPPAFRNKGHYTSLLKCFLNSHPEAVSVIYARKNNAASLRAIEKAGFVPVRTRRVDLPAMLRFD